MGTYYSSSTSTGAKGTSTLSTGRWDVDNSHSNSTIHASTTMNDGFILLLEEASNLSNTNPGEEDHENHTDKKSILLQHLVYHNNEHHNLSSRNTNNNDHHPKRGEFVSFCYSKGGKVKDIKMLKNHHYKAYPSKVIGILTNFDKEHQTLCFKSLIMIIKLLMTKLFCLLIPSRQMKYYDVILHPSRQRHKWKEYYTKVRYMVCVAYLIYT